MIMTKNNHAKVKYRVWIRILTIAIIVNLVITLGRGAMFLEMYQHFETNTRINLSLSQADYLLLHDTILTDSALLYAHTGDSHYKNEYDQANINLTRTIENISQLLQDTQKIIEKKQKLWGWMGQIDDGEIPKALARIHELNRVNDELLKIEQRSFALIEHSTSCVMNSDLINNKCPNALAISVLTSNEYANLEVIYHDDIATIVKIAKALVAKDESDVSLQNRVIIGITTTSAVILLLIWLLSIRAIKRWHREQETYELELEKTHSELEQLVEQRTQALSEVNSELFVANQEFKKLNTSLEQKVQERTVKLQEMNDEFRVLNETLSESIEVEVKNSREKDAMLVQQSRLAMMGEMMGNIAHQWRQPINELNLVLANIEDAYRYNDLTETYLHQQVAKGERLVQSMSSTIDDFRNFFKSDDLQQVFEIDHAIKDALGIIESSLKSNHIEVEIHTPQSVSTSGFEGQYRQVILNILGNAKDALLERHVLNGKIVITLAQENDCAVLRIQDNAGGIKDEVIQKIFDPYFTTRPKGNGIGLYMSKRIIENNMHGELRVNNTGEGAEFVIKTKLDGAGDFNS
jgi:signal transduction histidine kinase